MRSDVELVRAMDAPAVFEPLPDQPGPYFPANESWPKVRAEMQAHRDLMVAQHARSVAAARAELERRGVDVEAVRRRIRAYVAELRKLPELEIEMIATGEDDAAGLSVVALDLLEGRFDDEGKS